MDIISVSLHKMNLKSDLICGTVIVHVRPGLPVNVVSILLGNYLAGGYVNQLFPMIPAMKLIMMTKVSVVFPACAVTKRMTAKVALEANNEDEGEDSVPNLDLEGTLMTQLDEPRHLSSFRGEKFSKS